MRTSNRAVLWTLTSTFFTICKFVLELFLFFVKCEMPILFSVNCERPILFSVKQNKTWRSMSEVVSLAPLWLDSDTYQGSLDDF